MKKFDCLIGVLIALFVILFSFVTTNAIAQTTEGLSGSKIRAVTGDTVWVLLNHIKADKREEFEKFIHEIFWPKAANLDETDQQVFRQTRVLHPVEMNKDSTYTYVFLMDPVIPGKNYEILDLLKKMYSEEQAKEYYDKFDECYVGPQTWYKLIQSQH